MANKNVLLITTSVTLVFTSVLFSAAPTAGTSESDSAQVVRLELVCDRSAVVDSIASLFQRQVQRRCSATVRTFGSGDVTIKLAMDNSIGKEGFRIEDGADGVISIVGNDERGLLYGVGKFLRTSRYGQGTFTPGTWRGTSVPARPVRGIYFASHFHNYYATAPAEEIQQYVEELALWGHNAIMIWYDMHHYTGFDDPKAVKFRQLFDRVFQAAKNIGMDIGFLEIANEGYSSTPKSLRQIPPRVHGYACDICPNKPGGLDLILNNLRQSHQWYAQFSPAYLCVWPYDPGGCGCDKCKPWGSNGFLKASKAIAELTRQHLPTAKIVLSTWLFDKQEWQGLLEQFPQKPDWIDYLMGGDQKRSLHHGLKYGFPNIPLLEFPEISMLGSRPWGGYGAIVKPKFFQGLHAQSTHRPHLAGGFPYSEGIFEDMHKILCVQFYWDPAQTATDILREYVSFEYSPEVVDEVLEAIQILENNHFKKIAPRSHGVKQGIKDSDVRLEQSITDSAVKAYELVKSIDAKLTSQTRNSWRWRILYLRALVDYEIFKSGGTLKGETVKEAFQELTEMYYAQNAYECVKPPIAFTE